MDDLRVLVVDDERLLHPIYGRIATRAGLQFDLAADARSAYELLRLHNYTCAVIDKNLPSADGVEIVRAAKTRNPNTEIVMVTGYATLDSAIACVRLGVHDYLVKPFSPEDLARSLKNAIDRSLSNQDIQGKISRMESEGLDAETQLVAADRLATLGTLAGGVGHELNNITSALFGAIGELREAAANGEPPSPDLIKDLETVSEHLRTHGKQLLNLGRPGPEHEDRFDFRDTVTHTAALMRSTGRTKYVDVRIEMPAQPLWVTVNRTRVEQILLNLIGNAADALAGVKKSPTITVTAWQDNPRGRVFCRVDDNGCGMSEDVFKRIFEPYFTTKKAGQGTGLGLPVVRQIVESYGGMLQLQTQTGVGTSVVFDIPEAKLATLLPPSVRG